MRRNVKKIIFILIFLLGIGFAAVSTTLIINGTSKFGTNDSDFKVIFTRSVIDGVDVSNTTISNDGKSLTFVTKNLEVENDESVLNFEVTNNSTQYDANVTMECISNGKKTDYYKIEHTIPNIIEV